METYKYFEHTLNIKSPCTYVSNKRQNVLRDIEATFLNKCYGGYLITKIDDIVNMSQCRTVNSNQNAICIINVYFKALVRYYSINDIISNVRICISEGQICGIGDNIIVTFSNSPNNKILSNGQTVPVIVGNKIHYNTGSKNVNILGSILLPFTTTNVYKLTGMLDITTQKTQNMFEEYLQLIKDQDKALNTPDAKKFTALLNSYEKTTKDGIELTKLIKDAFSKPVDVTGYWSKNLKTSSDECYYIKEKNNTNDEFIDIAVNEGFINMLKSCYSIRKGIIELSITYKDTNMYEQADSVWELMKRNKL